MAQSTVYYWEFSSSCILFTVIIDEWKGAKFDIMVQSVTNKNNKYKKWKKICCKCQRNYIPTNMTKKRTEVVNKPRMTVTKNIY